MFLQRYNIDPGAVIDEEAVRRLLSQLDKGIGVRHFGKLPRAYFMCTQ